MIGVKREMIVGLQDVFTTFSFKVFALSRALFASESKGIQELFF